jgi:nitroreductase
MQVSHVAATAALRRAAIRATHAYSVHNTQPWRLELSGDRLDLLVDASQRLQALDPAGRQLAISLGCAIFDARVALANAGHRAVVERLPDPMQPDLVGRIALDDDVEQLTFDCIATYDSLVEQRQSQTSDFLPDEVPVEVLVAVEDAARAEDTLACIVRPVAVRHRLAELCRQAREIQLVDPASRAELRAWTAYAPPEPDYDKLQAGVVLVLGSARDDRMQWVRTGEALERTLLEVTRRGFAARPVGSVVEVPSTCAALQSELALDWQPHVLVSIGRAPLQPQPRRRHLVDVLFEAL